MGVLLVIAGTLAYAFNVIIAPFIYAAGSDPLTMIAFRSVVFAGVLGPALLLLGHPIRMAPRERLFSMGLGVLFTVQTLCFYTAISRIPVSVGTLIEYTYPFQVAVVSRFLFGELLTFRRMVLIVVALVGLATVLETPALDGALDHLGVFLMVLSSMLLTVKILLTHRLLMNIDSRRLGLYISATVAMVCIGVYLLTALEPAWPTTERGWLLLSLAPLNSLVGVLCFYTGLAMIGPGRAAMLSNSEPLFILILAVLLLGETFTLGQTIGAGMVVVAIVLFQLTRVQRKEPG